MEVQHVELVRRAVQRRSSMREMRGDVGVAGDRRVEAERAGRGRREPGASVRIAAREEGDVVTQIDQRLDEVRHDAFGAAVEAGWHGLEERRDLRDAQTFARRRPAAMRLRVCCCHAIHDDSS